MIIKKDVPGQMRSKPGLIELMSSFNIVKEACVTGYQCEIVNKVFCDYIFIIQEALKTYPLFTDLTIERAN